MIPLRFPPEALLRFLNQDLRLGKKHLLLVLGEPESAWALSLAQQIHTLCIFSPHSQLQEQNNVLHLDASGSEIPLDDDTIDCALILSHNSENWLQNHWARELRRVLRLNSYVLILENRPAPEFSPFTAAWLQWQKQFFQIPEFESSALDFLGEQAQTWLYDYQESYTWEQLAEVLPQDRPMATKALRVLFKQHRQREQVSLQGQLRLYYGLFNRYMPAISLRKNLFFQALRPFAFGFYVLVKMNIYFWRLLYRLRKRSES